MRRLERFIYLRLKYKFEKNLGRRLTNDEKAFLKWLAEKDAKSSTKYFIKL